MTKLWRIYLVGKASKGFDKREDAVKFLSDTIASGGRVKDILWKGNVISAKNTFGFIRDAGIKLSKISN